jgi:hypothetical protein
MPAPERKPFLLRIPPELLRELEKWAADELRSTNGQIEFLLRQAVAKRKNAGDSEPTEDK